MSQTFDEERFHLTTGAKLFYMIFVVIGLGVMSAFTISLLKSGHLDFRIERLLPILIGAVFFLVGTCLMRSSMTPIVFDRTLGFFWKGRKSPNQVFNIDKIKEIACMDEIYALQSISEYCRGDKSSYYSNELNLILQNGERMNVIDHGNKNKIREDAAALASFLKVPIWDGIPN